MKDALKQILGKRIAGVVVAQSDRDPRQQVFLVFSDGTRFEFYGPDFTCCGGLDEAARIPEYVESGGGHVRAVYGDSLPRRRVQPALAGAAPEEESLEALLRRDLGAWTEAKAAIARARLG
jgi:hypothetical protein